MNRGDSARSPNASRNSRTHRFRPCSKSTNVSLTQISSRSWSRVTSSPGRAASTANTRHAWGRSRTARPDLSSSFRSRSSSNDAKRIKDPTLLTRINLCKPSVSSGLHPHQKLTLRELIGVGPQLTVAVPLSRDAKKERWTMTRRAATNCRRAMWMAAVVLLALGSNGLRAEGTIVTFDVTGAGKLFGQGTYPQSINERGDLAGFWVDANEVQHGFIRDRDGSSAIFDVSDAGTGPNQGTVPLSINARGAVAGLYVDAGFAQHAFIRSPNGDMTTWDATGAGSAPGQGTVAVSMNSRGDVAGFFVDANFLSHAYVRDQRGGMVTFDASGGLRGTSAETINAQGDSAGDYRDGNRAFHGFVRDKHGLLTTFDAPGAGSGRSQGTFANGINADGEVAGYFRDALGGVHGFVRDDAGAIVAFDPPGPLVTTAG